MGRLCHCHAIIMCIVIFSGMKESDALNVNNDIGGKNDDTVNETGGSHIGSPRGSRSNVGSTSHNFNNTIDKGYNRKFPKICQKAPETGVCKAYIPTWYFDLWDEVCKIFIYGGCGGNENQFESEKKCQRKCLPLRRRRPVCGEKMKTTKCRHPKLTWYFNADKGTCHKIGEGKCGIRPNAFPSCKVCMKRCSNLNAVHTCGSTNTTPQLGPE
ncbi:amblin-like [Rhipicephalus microplus]|uniref:amblin-like n=1 Tax=Rhipicephalus microplus TaxID=6941 RepID=UPI003F6D0907